MDITQHLFSFIIGLSGLLYLPFGIWLWKRPPKKINGWIGYRSARSMKSQASWDYAQVYAGKLLFYCGLALLALALICLPLSIKGAVTVWLPTVVILAFAVLPIYLTERKLKALN